MVQLSTIRSDQCGSVMFILHGRDFLNPATVAAIQHILEPEYKGSIGRASAWAEDHAHTTERSFLYEWH